MSLRLYEIAVTHPTTREVLRVHGQGDGVKAALKDAADVVSLAFKPKADGKPTADPKCNVLAKDGSVVLRTLAEFEGA